MEPTERKIKIIDDRYSKKVRFDELCTGDPFIRMGDLFIKTGCDEAFNLHYSYLTNGIEEHDLVQPAKITITIEKS